MTDQSDLTIRMTADMCGDIIVRLAVELGSFDRDHALAVLQEIAQGVATDAERLVAQGAAAGFPAAGVGRQLAGPVSAIRTALLRASDQVVAAEGPPQLKH